MTSALDDVTCRPDWAALTDLLTFARLETSTRDVEPWADLLTEVHVRGDLDRESVLWAATLYNTYDDLGSAWAVYSRWPTPQAWQRAPDSNDAAAYPCTQERRNLRGGRVLLRLGSFADQLAGRSIDDWMGRPLVGDNPRRDFDRLTSWMRSVWGVGRQAAFEWAEFAGKVAGLPVECGNAQLWASEGPRRSLQRLYGNPRPTERWLDARCDETVAWLFDMNCRVELVDFETVVCDFNVMRDGRYYVGKHLAALREEIDVMPHGGREMFNRAWSAVVPEPWASIPAGVNKLWEPIYRDTGLIVADPHPNVPLTRGAP